MKFFDREREIQRLQEIRELSRQNSQFTVVTGRRRIGKTTLVMKAYEDEPFLYFFVARSTESELCRDFADEIVRKLNYPILGRVDRFADIFEFVMKLSEQRPITLMIDEFQDFQRVNGAIFSQIQKIWDLNKAKAHLNLVVCGSIYSMMTKLFLGKKESLYGRQTEFMKIEPFAPSVLKQILLTYNPSYTFEDLLALYAFTGGVAKYVELLVDSGALTKELMQERMLAKNSYFIYEGKNMLIEEFGRDYGRYFDILKLVASGHNSRGDIDGMLHVEVSGYLTRLEKDYGLLTKRIPMFQQTAFKNVRYNIDDKFLRFWFRFIYKYNHIIEANANELLLEILHRDYDTYSGIVLEDYFKDMLLETSNYTQIGSWWDRKGENEIDIIAANELTKTVTFFEVKRQESEFRQSLLEEKSNKFFEATGKFRKYAVSLVCLSMKDM